MTRFSFTFNGQALIARASFRATRNGFAHDCEILDAQSYSTLFEVTAHYLNRTWESYEFESVLHQAICKIRDLYIAQDIKEWKEENGKTRISTEAKTAIEAKWREAKERAYESIKAL